MCLFELNRCQAKFSVYLRNQILETIKFRFRLSYYEKTSSQFSPVKTITIQVLQP